MRRPNNILRFLHDYSRLQYTEIVFKTVIRIFSTLRIIRIGVYNKRNIYLVFTNINNIILILKEFEFEHKNIKILQIKMYVLFASEIAALIGENRYKTIDTIIIRLWKKLYQTDFRNCKNQLDDSSNSIMRTKEEVGKDDINKMDEQRKKTTTKIINKATSTQPPSEIVQYITDHISKDPIVNILPGHIRKRKLDEFQSSVEDVKLSLTKSIENTEIKLGASSKDVVDIIYSNRPEMALLILKERNIASEKKCKQIIDTIQTAVKKTISTNLVIPSISNSIDTIYKNECTKQLKLSLQNIITTEPAKSLLHSKINTRSGIIQEQSSLDIFEKTTEKIISRNSKGHIRKILCTGWSFAIYGKVDGIQQNNIVIEAKQRQNRLFGRLIEREKIQLYTYLYITGCKKGILIETFEKIQNKYNIIFEESVWEEYMKRIYKNVEHIHFILTDKNCEKRLDVLKRIYKYN